MAPEIGHTRIILVYVQPHIYKDRSHMSTAKSTSPHPLLRMALMSPGDATTAQDGRVTRYLFLAGIVILSYDHLLTLGSECTYVWSAGRRRSVCWYLFVRYFALCSNMAMLAITFGDFDSESCYKLNDAHGILLVVQESLVGCTLIVRVLAMYAFDRRVVFTLSSAEIIVLVVAAWSIVPDGPTPTYETSLPGCHTPRSTSQYRHMAIAWATQLTVDILLLGFTLYNGYVRSCTGILPRRSLLRVLVRDESFAARCPMKRLNDARFERKTPAYLIDLEYHRPTTSLSIHPSTLCLSASSSTASTLLTDAAAHGKGMPPAGRRHLRRPKKRTAAARAWETCSPPPRGGRLPRPPSPQRPRSHRGHTRALRLHDAADPDADGNPPSLSLNPDSMVLGPGRRN
ncbi:hypothetical protein DFH09DRAFT_1278466 [Mycena vulgaris]|nr:hypothetical protein DFH09DRAFT_1278466 [Mycena vulgaris]